MSEMHKCPTCGSYLQGGNEGHAQKNGDRLFVVWRRAIGSTFVDIGKAIGVSAPTARKIFLQEQDKYGDSMQWFRLDPHELTIRKGMAERHGNNLVGEHPV